MFSCTRSNEQQEDAESLNSRSPNHHGPSSYLKVNQILRPPHLKGSSFIYDKNNTPPKFNMEPKKETILKENVFFQPSIFGWHVCFQGV